MRSSQRTSLRTQSSVASPHACWETGVTSTNRADSQQMSRLLDRVRAWRQRVYNFNYFNRDQWVAAWAARTPAGAVVLDVGAGPGKYRGLFAHCDYRAHDFGQEPGTRGRYTRLDYESDITAIPIA